MMRACVEKVLVIGGGFSGMSAAIELSKKGIAQGEILKFPVKGLVTRK